MIEIVEQYKEEGYYIFRNLYSKEYCNELKEYLNTLEVKRYIPFSNIPWGWGNLLDKGPFTKITENKIFNKFCKKLFKSDNYIFPNMMINNKASWIGPEVEWHREIYPKSHIINDLPYENIVDSNFGHKRRVSSEAMKKVNTLCEHIYCEMEVGDMLVFTDKTVHGSNANKSPDDRKSVVLGVRHNVKKYNEEVYKKSTNYRRNFIVTELQSVIDKIKSSNMYSDFNKEKNEV